MNSHHGYDSPLNIILVAGARPNFMKIAPLLDEMNEYPEFFAPTFVHTGQHYDGGLSSCFLQQLNMPGPDYYLSVGSGTHARQTAQTIERFDEVLANEQPDAVIVVGDVNSTIGCALATAKRNIPLAHVEAGLRSGDMSMPEEVNRIVTDAVSDLLFTHCEDANDNLRREGVDDSRIFYVGNIMADSLYKLQKEAALLNMPFTMGLQEHGYYLVTLHRPSVVDDEEKIKEVINALLELSISLPVIFPVHPRTGAILEKMGLTNRHDGSRLKLVEPLGYLEFLSLQSKAYAVLTDSGGIQEETTILNIPCFTFRDNTERPVTVTEGTNTLIGTNPSSILDIPRLIDAEEGQARKKQHQIPCLWDGATASRVLLSLAGFLNTAIPESMTTKMAVEKIPE